ncbi:type II restriction endonuclease [Candidatus Poribacteria bacterium]|nr:MAG: type II restriction endonuclease [Candidatus Poribacteria bacterium]
MTVAFTDRRPHKIDADRDVLGQVTLIKDIRLNNPHRAHLDILSELSFEACVQWIDSNRKPKNFDGLLSAWLAKLDTEALNKQFYRNLFAWYEWAIETATFPTDENRVLKPEEHVIRLITRLLFIWFIKEKGLVAEALFNKSQIQDLLAEDDFDSGDAYYRAVLQNLFFATLNTEIDERKFSKGNYAGNRNFSRFRYKKQMRDPDKLLELFAKTPFINGGLFDCLDTFDGPKEGGYRIDCFSDVDYKKLSVPNRLFFDIQQGLIPLLEHYKFTVEENTPIEQEVALDPELLGRVFENLLAAYNPETGATVRKQTGSYYTPRPIVDYMVEEALVATLSQKSDPTDGDAELWDERLHYLLDYAQTFDDANEWFDDPETGAIVRAISELKILDPAVGSGAFPMGMLHKLTLALRRLDPDNTRWEKLQKERALQRTEAAYDTQDDQTRREELLEIDETFKRYRDSDFGRKLYLIQNSIFGVDLQSVACQIAKLRFFISLAIEQEPEQDTENFGIKPLPNLETRFIAANTLIGLAEERTLTSQKAQDLERELSDNRERHFHATTRQQKRTCKQKDTELRTELATELKSIGMPADDAEKIAGWDPYDQNATADWFDSEWMFGITEGFDVVIGNPPYIQLQKEGGRLGNLYQNRGFDTFVRTGDIYCLFYEKANQLLKNSGHVCFITSNKWMRAGYGKKLRDYFVTLTQPIQLLDMGPDVFDATVDTNILLFQKTVSDASTAFIGVSLKADFDRQTSSIARYLIDNGSTMEMPAKGEPWAILSSAELNLKRKIENIGKPLEDWDINVYRGIVTGCNEAFIITEAKREELIKQDPKSVEIIKPLLRGRDIQRYYVQRAESYMLATDYDLNVSTRYLAIYAHLETIGEQIESGKIRARGKGLFNRDDQGINWWNLRACAYYAEFDKEKIVWKRIGSILRFAYIQHPMYCLDSTCIATGEKVKFLTAVLNSRVAHYQLFDIAPKTGTGDLIVSVQALEPLLVPPITNANQHLVTEIENKVDRIITAKQTDSDVDISDLENEIDTLVYELYNLTEAEIAIVEGKA